MNLFIVFLVVYWGACSICLFLLSMDRDEAVATLGPVFGFAGFLFVFMFILDGISGFNNYYKQKMLKKQVVQNVVVRYQDNKKYPSNDIYKIKEQIARERKALTQRRAIFEQAVREDRKNRLGLAIDAQFSELRLAVLIRKHNRWQLHYNSFLVGDPVFKDLLISYKI